jgi:glycerophosphoryl diester phosphodiesterase
MLDCDCTADWATNVSTQRGAKPAGVAWVVSSYCFHGKPRPRGVLSGTTLAQVRPSASPHPCSPLAPESCHYGLVITSLRPAWLVSSPIAHRGLHDLRAGLPENSLAAFEAAAEAGYPCELDVQLTNSGELIVLHDFELSRPIGVARPTATLTAGDLPSTRLFGSDQHIPTLTQVIKCVRGRIPLLIELKREGASDPQALVNAVLENLKQCNGEYAFSSFNPFVVYALRTAKSGTPIGQISGVLRTAGPLRRIIGRSMVSNFLTHPDFISYELAGLPSRTAQMWRNRGVTVIAWPVKSPDEERQARKYADNIIFSDFLPRIN